MKDPSVAANDPLSKEIPSWLLPSWSHFHMHFSKGADWLCCSTGSSEACTLDIALQQHSDVSEKSDFQAINGISQR